VKGRIPLKRRKEGRTDYRQRLDLIKSWKPRLVVRRSNKHFTAQLIDYSEGGDEVLTGVHSNELRDYGWKASTSNTSAAYLTGFLLGSRAENVEAVLDLGLHKVDPGSNLFAVAIGARDAGVEVPVGDDVVPSEERVRGEHVADYADEGDFSSYEERGLDPAELPEHFEEVKSAIEQEVQE